ncbi:MAG: WD40 repeat domain-containing protein [Nocardioides sp.]
MSSDIGSGASAEWALQAARDALEGYGPQAFDVWDSDQRKVTISHVISATLNGLDTNVQVPGGDGMRDRYLSMAVFPPSTPIPLDVLSRWWGEAHGWSPVAVRHFCRILADRSLISAYRADREDIVLHDVFRAYLRGLVAPNLPELHQSLLDALRPATGWSTLSADRLYEWDNVAYHLVGAADYGSLARLTSDPKYVIGKATACGANALRSDRDLVTTAQAETTDPEHTLLLDRAHLLAEHGYLLHGLKTESEMAVTLLVALARAGHQPPDELVSMASRAGADVRWSHEAADTGNPGHVGTAVAIESRGDLLVSGGEDGLVRLWDLKSRTLTRTLSGHTGWVHSVAISPDSSLVASAGEDNVIRLWAVADGSQIGVLPGHHKRIRSLAFVERSAELASGAEDGLIKFWDLSSLTLARQMTTRGVGIWSISLSEDGSMVAASGEDEYVRLLDVPTGELLDEKALHSNWVRAVRFRSRDELVSAAADGTARLWDTSNRELDPAGVLDADAERLRALAVHAGEVITAGENATITAHGASPQQVGMPASVNWIRAVTSTPYGVAAGCEDGGIRLWNPGDDTLELIAAGRDTTWAAAFTERGIAMGGADGKIRVHDANTGATASALPAGTGRVWALASSGSYVAGACGDGRLRVWHDHQLVHEFNDDVTLTWAVQISQDATLMAASDTNGHVRVWTLPDGRLVWDHDAAAGRVRSLSISASAGLIAAAGGDGTVRMWTLAEGEERETIKVPGWARTVTFDRLGERLAIGTGTGDIYVHRLGTAEDPVHLQGHQGRVLLLGFSDDGAWLISTAADGTARRWPLEEGTAFQVRVDASGQCAALDPSTMDLLVASASGQVLIRLGSGTTGATG